VTTQSKRRFRGAKHQYWTARKRPFPMQRLKRVLVNGYWMLLWAQDILLRWRPLKAPTGKSALIVHLGALGDFLLWVKQGCALADRWRSEGYRVTLVANSAWGDLAAALPEFDEVIRLDRRRFERNLRYRWRTMRRIRACHASKALNAQLSRELAWGESVMATCGAESRIGQTGDLANISLWQRRFADSWYTQMVESSSDEDEISRNAHFAKHLGVAIDTRSQGFPEWLNSPISKRLPDQFFIVAPGAGWSGRRWPLDRFASIVQQVFNAKNWVPVICGSTSERYLSEELMRLAGNAHVIDLTGQTSLVDLCSVVARAKLVLANESGIVHLAALLQVPAVSIVGGGHFGRFLPYVKSNDLTPPEPVFHRMRCFGCNWRCIYPVPRDAAVPCIERIAVELVREKVSDILHEPTAHTHAGTRN